MSWEEKVEGMSSRYIWVIMFLAFFIPIAFPIGLPAYPVHESTIKLYEALEELPEGSVVLMDIIIGFASMPDSGTPMVAVAEHLARLPVKVIYRPRNPEPVQIIENVQDDLKLRNRKEYGVDFINMPYVAGQEAALLSFLDDIHSSVQTDAYGTPIGDIPMMQDIKSAEDIDFVVATISGYADVEIRVYSVTHSIPLATVNFGGSGPYMQIYVDAGTLYTNLSGLRAGADYERLIKAPGRGISSLDALTLNYIAIFTLIILGNVAYLRLRSKEREVI